MYRVERSTQPPAVLHHRRRCTAESLRRLRGSRELLGHASLQTTVRYIAPSPRALIEEANRAVRVHAAYQRAADAVLAGNSLATLHLDTTNH